MFRHFKAALLALPAVICAAPATAGDAAFAEPQPVKGTAFLDHARLLRTLDDPRWYDANVPLLEVPDKQIQEVYYYRWQLYREHLTYTGPVYGWMQTEFITPVPYAAPFGGISAAAGHHIIEGRWLRDRGYGQDLVNYWLAGPGQFARGGYPPDLTDWAHAYSFWAGAAVWQQYLATGDRGFVTAQLPNLVRQYRGWDVRLDPALGLYWQSPARDATERTPASFQSGEPMRGGVGYRPPLNAYQYGDALGIAAIARLAGDGATATRYTGEATALKAATRKWLWDPERRFFYEIVRDNNPQRKRLDTRIEAGFVPWAFGLPELAEVSGFAELFDKQGFAAPFGPTSVERRSPWFGHNIARCCHWTGPSWPFQTSQVLTGMENLLIDYGPQTVVTRADYLRQLQIYARTQYKDGRPYTAEAHATDADRWIYDRPNHSEDYSHSTYVDNIIAGLVGLRAQPDDTLVVSPLAPAEWDYFALENAPYHGHAVTVLWDRTGAKYKQGAGLRVFVDGRLAGSNAALTRLTVPVGAAVLTPASQQRVNVAANPLKFDHGAQPIVSSGGEGNDGWQAIDGAVFRPGIPPRSHWASGGKDGFLGVDLRQPVRVVAANVVFFDDGQSIRMPSSARLQHWTGSDWADIPGQRHGALERNARVAFSFPALTTSRVRVVASGGGGWGVSEIEVMAPPLFRIENAASGKPLAPAGGAAPAYWQMLRQSDGTIELTAPGNGGALAAASGALRTAPRQVGAAASRQHWVFHDIGGGRFRIVNAADAVQIGDTGLVPAPKLNDRASLRTDPAQLWRMLPVSDAAGR